MQKTKIIDQLLGIVLIEHNNCPIISWILFGNLLYQKVQYIGDEVPLISHRLYQIVQMYGKFTLHDLCYHYLWKAINNLYLPLYIKTIYFIAFCSWKSVFSFSIRLSCSWSMADLKKRLFLLHGKIPIPLIAISCQDRAPILTSHNLTPIKLNPIRQ